MMANSNAQHGPGGRLTGYSARFDSTTDRYRAMHHTTAEYGAQVRVPHHPVVRFLLRPLGAALPLPLYFAKLYMDGKSGQVQVQADNKAPEESAVANASTAAAKV